MTGLL
jgi:hypothetical protein